MQRMIGYGFGISIHALREEGDRRKAPHHSQDRYFYPRPPRGGRRCGKEVFTNIRAISIHALREEGDPQRHRILHTSFISIHALREEGDLQPPGGCPQLDISIHALREEGDPLLLPLGAVVQQISIHALREEGDLLRGCSFASAGHFYPRPPRGGRRVAQVNALAHTGFLSTPSARRATTGWVTLPASTGFLSTPSARRATRADALELDLDQHFYPRPPRGGRHGVARDHQMVLLFLSTPSARRATRPSCASLQTSWNFYPRPPRGGRRRVDYDKQNPRVISIHALREEGDAASLQVVPAIA